MAGQPRRWITALASWALLATIVSACSDARPRLIRLQGSGASFPAPLYGRWFKSYNRAHPHVQIDYQSVGSGSGVKSVIDGTVDFAASDAAMSDEEMKRVRRGVQLLPMTAGSIVLAYNLPGVRALKLSREAYAGIFLGRIKKWNDPAIARAQPDQHLPDLPIHLTVRADSSGTTFVLTKHLSAVSREFAQGPGTNKMPNWPSGRRAKGNEGIAATIKTTPGAIGYLEFGYAKTQALPVAMLENRAGAFVQASTRSGQATLAGAQFAPTLIAWNPDPTEPHAYPMATYTWLILYRHYRDPDKLEALRDFVRYGLSEGQNLAEPLGYIPLPDTVRDKVRGALAQVQLAALERLLRGPLGGTPLRAEAGLADNAQRYAAFARAVALP